MSLSGQQTVPEQHAPGDAPPTLLDIFHANPGVSLSRSDIMAQLPLSVSDWSKQVASLVKSGDVVKTGKKRGTRYRASRGVVRPGRSDGSRVRRLSEIEPEAVSFLWSPYIPLSKLTLLEGDPGQGKSTITWAIAAAGSLGVALPGNAKPSEPWSTLFFTAEDGLADTLRPRLDAMGADCTFILAHPEAVNLSTSEGLAEVDREIATHLPRLVVVDPIVAYVGARTDTYRANEVRAILAPLAEIAERNLCAIVCVRHLTKAKGGRSIYAGQGSIDFTAAARSVLLAGSAADDPNERAMIHIKCNVAPLGLSLGYSIRDGRFEWTGESALTAGDLLAPEQSGHDPTAGEDALAFLKGELAGGPAEAVAVKASASQLGISERTLWRAKGKLGVKAKKRGFGKESVWIWQLPVDM